MIERIFCGAVTRGSAQKEGRMSYTEFVWFLLSEEVSLSNSYGLILYNCQYIHFQPIRACCTIKLFIQKSVYCKLSCNTTLTLPGQTPPNSDRVLVPMYGPRRRRTTLYVSTRETFPFHQLCIPFVRLAHLCVRRYELEYFYEEQLQRMEQLGIETLPFDDCLCQVRPFVFSLLSGRRFHQFARSPSPFRCLT